MKELLETISAKYEFDGVMVDVMTTVSYWKPDDELKTDDDAQLNVNLCSESSDSSAIG